MYIIDYFKNAIKTKSIKTFIYIIVSFAINILIFWAIYEKLLKQPNGIVYGIGIYFICFLLLLTPLYREIGKAFFESNVTKNNGCCPKTRELFEKIKNEYIKAGYKNVKNMKLTIYDEAYFKDSNELFVVGGKEICINAIADSLPDDINLGRLATGIDMALYGSGACKTLPTACNPFYFACCLIIGLIRDLSSKIWGNLGFNKIKEGTEYENEILGSVLLKWINLGEKCFSLKYNDTFFKFLYNTPFAEEKEVFIDNLR